MNNTNDNNKNNNNNPNNINNNNKNKKTTKTKTTTAGASIEHLLTPTKHNINNYTIMNYITNI